MNRFALLSRFIRTIHDQVSLSEPPYLGGQYLPFRISFVQFVPFVSFVIEQFCIRSHEAHPLITNCTNNANYTNQS